MITSFTTFLLLLTLLAPVKADTPIEQQRADFLAAEAALNQGDVARYEQLRKSLSDYPLIPYLDYSALLKKLDVIQIDVAEQFLLRNHETPLAKRFRRALLNRLGKDGRWKDYLKFYHADGNSQRHCLYARALLATGRTAAAMAEAPSLWLNPRSMPKSCDPVFSVWRKQGLLTTQLVWQRISLAMNKRNLRLANYLERYLPGEERKWFKQWLAVDADPDTVVTFTREASANPMQVEIIRHGLERLARKNPARANEVWEALGSTAPFDADQRYRIERAIMAGWMRTDHPQAIAKLDRFSPREDDHHMHERRIREALSRQAWKPALRWIEKLPVELSTQENWRYWRAKLLAAQGAREQAESLFRELAKERSYHGFLAADHIGEAYNLDHQLLSVPPEEIAALADRADFRRAAELFQLGRLIDARREWHAATRNLTSEQMKPAAKLAQRWGWHSQAIFTLAKSGYWEDLELRFPLQHETVVADAAKRNDLDKSWVLAVIRQESAFSPDARSHAGAMGLMQLMPATARATAKQMRRRTPRRSDLFKPDVNIAIGTGYLKRVYERLGDNTVLAISAYNAGPHRVQRWLPTKHTLDADLWVETIPFRETRRYTQRVLAYSVIYDQRLGKKITHLKDRMPKITPRKVKIQSASL